MQLNVILQVQFNEAVSRVCQEKDRMIEDLKAEIRTLKVKGECILFV